MHCAHCSHSAPQFKCEGCNTQLYCGTACQKQDWELHKYECISGGPLIVCGNEYCENMITMDYDHACTECGSIYYCSQECRVEDWPFHKKKCKPGARTPYYVKPPEPSKGYKNEKEEESAVEEKPVKKQKSQQKEFYGYKKETIEEEVEVEEFFLSILNASKFMKIFTALKIKFLENNIDYLIDPRTGLKLQRPIIAKIIEAYEYVERYIEIAGENFEIENFFTAIINASKLAGRFNETKIDFLLSYKLIDPRGDGYSELPYATIDSMIKAYRSGQKFITFSRTYTVPVLKNEK